MTTADVVAPLPKPGRHGARTVGEVSPNLGEQHLSRDPEEDGAGSQGAASIVGSHFSSMRVPKERTEWHRRVDDASRT